MKFRVPFLQKQTVVSAFRMCRPVWPVVVVVVV